MDEGENFEEVDVDSQFFTGESEQREEGGNYLSEQFTYKQVGSIVKYVEPVSGYNSIDTLTEMFRQDEKMAAVPVEENDHVIGIVDRKTVLEATGTTWKRLTSKRILDYMQEVPTILNGYEFIENVLHNVTKVNQELGIEYFPVFNRRSFMGLVSLDDFVARLSDIREQDQEKAASIQQHQFPSAEELGGLPFRVTAWNRMANKLGGDIYQVQKISDYETMISCFDVSGKNVAASLLTIAVSSFFKTLKLEGFGISNAITLVKKLDAYLADVVPAGNFITGILCFLDTKNFRLSVFNCGHTTAYLNYSYGDEANEVKTLSLPPRLPPFGMGAVSEQLKDLADADAKDRPFTMIKIRHGVHLDIYSDGFTDMQNGDLERYEDENAKEFFARLFAEEDDAVHDAIGREVDGYVGKMLIPDDITVVDVRY